LNLINDRINLLLIALMKGISGIAIGTTHGAARQSDKNRWKTNSRRFSLNRIEDFIDSDCFH
jgi:hypothetical protein